MVFFNGLEPRLGRRERQISFGRRFGLRVLQDSPQGGHLHSGLGQRRQRHDEGLMEGGLRHLVFRHTRIEDYDAVFFEFTHESCSLSSGFGP